LAYSGLDDATLANHQAGLPISVTKLESAWLHPDVVSITPIDYKVGIKVFSNWIANLAPMWLPSLVDADTTTDVSHTQERIGIAITEEIVRMWGDQNQEELLLIKNGEVSSFDIKLDSPSIIIASELTPGATLRNSKSSSLLFTPAF